MILENERLQIQFAEPEQFQNQRFDRTAVVSQVLLDETHTFCTKEQILPGRKSSHGVGLCGEFVLDGAAEKARSGEWFCKPGVGLLRQTDDYHPYDMWNRYEIHPAAVTAQHTDHSIVFHQKGIPWNDYGVNITKAFHLRENSLILDITVNNIGANACCLCEYQHNFICLDALLTGRGYILDLPCDADLKRIEQATLRQGDEVHLPSAVQVKGGSVYWMRDLENRVLYHRSERISIREPWSWNLHHTRTNLSVTEQTDFCPSRIDVWTVEHCICPEFYNKVALKPGEAACWRRTWTFHNTR